MQKKGIKIDKENALKLLVTILKSGTIDKENLIENYNNHISISFIDEIKKSDFLNKNLTAVLENKITKNIYSEGYEALISCFKKLFFAESSKTIILNSINKSSKMLNPDIYEYFINPFIFYCYASLDSLAFFLNEYFGLDLYDRDCDLLRPGFKKRINEKIELKNDDFNKLKEIKRIINNQLLLDLKGYRNNISHRFTIILPYTKLTGKRVVINNPKSNFMSFMKKLNINKDFYYVEDFLEIFFKVINNTRYTNCNFLN